MKNRTKFLICIASSILIISFLLNLGQYLLSLGATYTNDYILSNFSEGNANEAIQAMIDLNEEFYLETENIVNEFKNEFGDDKPYTGLLLEIFYQQGMSQVLTDNLTTSLIAGIMVGGVIYLVLISQSDKSKKIFQYTWLLLIVALIMTVFNVLYLNHMAEYTWLECIGFVGYYAVVLAIPYIALIAIMHLIYYIYQKILVKKLNAGLNKKEDIEKLDKKIGITLMVVGITIFAIVTIGLTVFNLAFQVIV